MKSIVLLCSHNGEKYIEEQINSVLNQTKPIDKLIVHDYNSKDRTRLIIRKIQSNDKRVILRDFNYSINPCHSFLNSISIIRDSFKDEYVLSIVDQDDFWTKRKNEKVLKVFSENNLIVFHDVFITNKDLEIEKNSYYNGFWNVKRDLKFPNQFFSNCVIGHTISMNKNLIKYLSFDYNQKIPMHDWHIINQCLLKRIKITFLNESLSYYRQHDGNILGAKIKTHNLLASFKDKGKNLNNYHNYLKDNFNSQHEKFDYSLFGLVKSIRPFKKLLILIITRILFYKS